jgi:oligopeptide/dipeptide ABC transporter ATP-binding protein
MPEQARGQDAPLLRVRNLQTRFQTDQGEALAVDGVSFDLAAGRILALVGESGCGKSVTALSILRLIPKPGGRIAGGEIFFEGRNLLALPETEMRFLRGSAISMIFQEPMTSMNPVFRVGSQITAALRLHRRLSAGEARREAIALLERVGIPAPERRIDNYPHEMSGGMLQRVMIAMALACRPRLLIADEPTTALDVTIQAQILNLLQDLQRETGMAILLITHDLGVVAEMADEVAVMYAGQIVEQAPVARLFAERLHPYTRGLFRALPDARGDRRPLYTIPGTVPAATHFPAGCRFHPRCPYVFAPCSARRPELLPVATEHRAACWRHDADALRMAGLAPGLPELEQATP